MQNIFIISLYLLLLSTEKNIYSQISLTFIKQKNTVCNGNACKYSGPSILINEVMLTPTDGDGSISGTGTGITGHGEWIELYNPDQCKPVDISCYYLGNNSPEVGIHYGGGYRIPANTIVPPRGFVVIRGKVAPAVPDHLLVKNGGNTIEYIVDNIAGNICLGHGATRLWFPNAGGWFAFYDANGVPQDAISWNNRTNSCTSCSPCIPSFNSCSNATLPSYDEISSIYKTYITQHNPEFNKGFSWKRIPDGGTWDTIPALPTMGDCNAECKKKPVITCNGKANVKVTGGKSPYTFEWNDAQSSVADSAVGLCEGQYCVTVTDANKNIKTACVNIENDVPMISTNKVPPICLTDSAINLYSFVWPKGGTFSRKNIFDPSENGAGLYKVIYTIKNDFECINSDTLEVIVTPLCSTLEIPNVFTPNGDGVNDAFSMIYQNIAEFHCVIFNRWGKLIYEWDNIQTSWNGETNSGNPASDGTYFYVLNAKGKDDKEFNKHGIVTLLR